MKKVDVVKSFLRFYIKHMLFCIQQSVRYARYQQFRVSYARYQQFRVSYARYQQFRVYKF